MYVCMYVYIYIYIHTYVNYAHIYIYIYLYICNKQPISQQAKTRKSSTLNIKSNNR